MSDTKDIFSYPNYNTLTHQRKDHADDCKDDRDNPIAHDHFFTRPADGFEMMMKWSETKDSVFVKIFVGNHLDDDRKRRDDQW